LLLAAALFVAGCGSERHVQRELVVGSGTDPEAVVLAEVYAAALRYYGTPTRVERVPDPFDQLDGGSVAVVAGFTGRILQRFAPSPKVIEQKSVYAAMVAALPEGVAAGDYVTAAEDKPAVAVTNATVGAWGGRDLTALEGHCAQVVPGAVTGVQPPIQLGICRLPVTRVFPSATALFDALTTNQINAAWTTTATPDVPAELVVLEDRKPQLVQAENVVPLYRRNTLSEQEVLALNEIAGEFDTSALADMRRQVAGGADPRQVAEAWLAAHPLGR
jgi:glycine betaine/choline ABC-type transport system substrate-binding protein